MKKAIVTVVVAVIALMAMYACFTIAIPLIGWLCELANTYPAVRFAAGIVLAVAFVLATLDRR